MDNTKQTIDIILAEIEKGSATDSAGGAKSMDEVIGILLNKDMEENQAAAPAGTVQPASGGNFHFDMVELRRWQERNNQIYHVGTDYPLGSTKPVIGWLDVLVKKIVRKLIRPIIYPIISRQNEFNASVTSSVNSLYNNELVTSSFMASANSEIASLRNSLNEVNTLKAEIVSLRNSLNEMDVLKAEMAVLKEQNERVTQELEAVKAVSQEEDVYSVIDYSSFEKNFRGEKELIKNNQRMYIPYFEGKSKVVDLGCGRGEFLELLKEYNIPAVGVDTYEEFVEECRKKHLDVVHDDALNYVTHCEDESLDGVFAAQIAEHLKIVDLAKLCQKAYDKLKFGGCFIMETPNPTCLATYTNAFYIDPTHTKPVHPLMLEYFLKDAGFTSVEILYTESSRVGYRLPLLNASGVANLQEFNDSINLLTEVLFGSQDYAIIARK